MSQKLIDGELTSYKWNYKDDEKRKDCLDDRFNLFTKFLGKIRTQAGTLDIINLQEIACEEDLNLLIRITNYLNNNSNDKYTLEIAREATGAQGLKVATIYNNNLAKQKDAGELLYKKGDKSIQFGMIHHF